MDVLARVQSLLDDGLHQSARVVCALALSDSRMRASAAMLPPPTTTLSHDDRVHLTVLLGDALVAAGEQRHAMVRKWKAVGGRESLLTRGHMMPPRYRQSTVCPPLRDSVITSRRFRCFTD